MAAYNFLLEQADHFCERTGMSPTALGKAACNDGNIIHDIRRGRRPNLDLVNQIQLFMIEYDRAYSVEGE